MAFYHYQSESEDDSEGIDGEDDDNRRRQAPSHASCRRWRDDDDSDIDLSSESEGEEGDKDVEDYQDSELATELFGVKINRGQTQGEDGEDIAGDNDEGESEHEDDNNNDADDGDNNEDIDGGQISPDITWKQKRKELVNMLADESHDIHLISGRTKKERCEKMYRRYAEQFDEKQVVDCLSRLLLQLKKKEGPFDTAKGSKKGKNSKDGKPHWKSRKKGKNSKAHDLLYLLRVRQEGGTGIDKMSAEEIWNTYPIFQEHDLEDFKKYDKDVVKLAAKHRKQIDEEVEEWQYQRRMVPRKTVTSRGKKFWSSHPANTRLIEDTKSGKASSMKPKELWKSHEDYQDFDLDDFRKHVYQEKYRQIAGPYWQKKRNRAALKEHLKVVENLYEDFIHNKWKEPLDELAEMVDNDLML
jgi:hypothetical protein